MYRHMALVTLCAIVGLLAPVSSAAAATPVSANASPEARALLNFIHLAENHGLSERQES